MITSVISGDIVSSTSLNDSGRVLIEESLKDLLIELKSSYDVYGRVIKGDYLECVVPDPGNALRVALIIKCFVKAIPVKATKHYKMNRRVKLFKTHGVRLAIGFGELSRFNPNEGIIDGEAIYLSGRTINESVAHGNERVVIKNTLYFVSNNNKLNNEFEPLFSLLDTIIGKATSKQSSVLYMKLMNNNEKSIAEELGIAQSVVNQHSTRSGWNAINKSVKYFSEVINNL